MLTPFDDYLTHQTPDSFASVATSDRNFFDRYYFGCHDLTGDTFLVVAMGAYPNVGVMDAFATCVQRRDKQFVVRASRALGADRSQSVVGPIGVEVIEGLRKIRVWCEPNEWGLDFDLTFEGLTAPFEEPHFNRRAGNKVVMDYSRLTQSGRWSGKLNVGGESHDVAPDGWWGARDHSWGIRPVGDREPAGAPDTNASRGFYWNWSPMQFGDHALMYTVSENDDASRWHEAAAFLYSDGRDQEELSVIRHDWKLKKGTRRFDGGSALLARADGSELLVQFEPLTQLHMAGAGYSYLGDRWRHGQYHGELEVEGETWDIADEEFLKTIQGQNQTVCKVTAGDASGYGIFELIVFGLYEPYGFKTPTDVAE